MATVCAKVLEYHKLNDVSYNVKICLHRQNQRRYIDTNHYVVKKQLTKDLRIRDPFIADKVEQQLGDYRKVLSELDEKLQFFTADNLRDFLRDKNEEVEFISFCSSHVERVKSEGRVGSAANFRIARNSLVDYVAWISGSASSWGRCL